MKALLAYLDWSVIFIAFSVGLAVNYVYMPQPKVVVMRPTPERHVTYQRTDGSCYTYEATEVACAAH